MKRTSMTKTTIRFHTMSAVLILLMLCVAIAGCGTVPRSSVNADNVETNSLIDDIGSTLDDSNQSNSNTPVNSTGNIKTNQAQLNKLAISDLEFIFGDSIFDGDKNASFQFVNDSEYEIFYIELMMRLKEGIEIPDELKESYEETIEWGHSVFVRVYFNEYWDNYMEDTNSFWADDILDPVKPGEMSGKVMVLRNNINYVKDSSEIELFDFEECTIRYYSDGGAYENTVIYNYKNDKHVYGEPEPAQEAVAIPPKEEPRKLSEDETPISVYNDIEIFTEITTDNNIEFWYTNNTEFVITEFSVYYRIGKEYFPKEIQDDIFISETFSFKYNDDVRPGATSNRRIMSASFNNEDTLEKLDKNNFRYASISEINVRYRDGDKKYRLFYRNGEYELTEV